MEWQDEGVVLSARPHGESGAVAHLLTARHGRHGGFVRRGRRGRGTLEPGTEVSARWRARVPENLGTFTLEPVRQHAAAFLDDADRLAALASACAVLDAALPERSPVPAVFEATRALLTGLAGPAWGTAYVTWEVGLLGELGYPLDLSRCAATGVLDDLVWVSPRTGRAVSREAGRPYADRLLPLPPFLVAGGAAADYPAVLDGLGLAEAFLMRHVLARGALPEPRRRLAERVGRRARNEKREHHG